MKNLEELKSELETLQSVEHLESLVNHTLEINRQYGYQMETSEEALQNMELELQYKIEDLENRIAQYITIKEKK